MSVDKVIFITLDIRQYVEDLIDRFNILYLNEITDFIYIEFDIILSVPTVCRLLKSIRLSYKKNQSIII